MGLLMTGWGHLGQDIEIQYSASGFAFGKTSVACKIPKKNADGTFGATEWVALTFLGKAAENAVNILHKGSKVWFQGYPQTDEFPDKNTGQTRKAMKVTVNQWEALDPNPNAQGGGQQQGGQQPQGGGYQPQFPQHPGQQQGGPGNQGQQPQGQQPPPQQQQPFNPNQPGNQSPNPPQQQGGFNPNPPQGQPQQQQGGGGFGPQNPANQPRPQGTGDDVPF